MSKNITISVEDFINCLESNKYINLINNSCRYSFSLDFNSDAIDIPEIPVNKNELVYVYCSDTTFGSNYKFDNNINISDITSLSSYYTWNDGTSFIINKNELYKFLMED